MENKRSSANDIVLILHPSDELFPPAGVLGVPEPDDPLLGAPGGELSVTVKLNHKEFQTKRISSDQLYVKKTSKSMGKSVIKTCLNQ